ncbi:MAG TPA: phosphotransferase family protein [Acidimicrobiaceae bacterium]|nr:phosphotransferase family protein [Acidimicrobiaceae bacterium]
MGLARRAGVPGPEVHMALRPEDGLGEGFVMEWVEGESIGSRINRSDELASARAGLAGECGRALARIHAIDLDSTGLNDALHEVDPAEEVRQTWERYKGFHSPQPMIDFTARWLLDHLPPEGEPALVHGDFRNGNLLVAPTGMAAVLDWEIAHIGDPMRDLGWLCTASWRFGHPEKPVGGFGSYEDLFAGYEAESGRAVDPAHVRFWEVFGSFWWSVGCLGMADQYRSGPDRSVERAAIGRRSSECQVDCVNLVIPGPAAGVVRAGGDDGPDLPRVDELVGSVREFLRSEVVPAMDGRAGFLARVAANSLDIVGREMEYGAEARRLEANRLRNLLGVDLPLGELRLLLAEGLRDGTIAVDADGLVEHLRQTVVNQVLIDQPTYPGCIAALGFDADS